MLTNRKNIIFQAEKHPLETRHIHTTLESYCLELVHRKAYEEVAIMSKGLKVLDYGCNDGYGTYIISNYCKEVIGIDVSAIAIKNAKEKYGQQGIEFHLFDGKRTSFDDKFFDRVVSLQVIEHIIDYDDYLNEIKRILTKDGVVLFTTPNATIRLDPGMKPLNPFHVKEFTPIELNNLLKKYFNKVEIRGLFATDVLYNVEYNRLKKGLERARKKPIFPSPWKIKAAFVNGVKAILPNCIYYITKRAFNRLEMGAKRLDKSVMTKYSTNDFFYLENNLEQSLDLMAICSVR